MLSPNAKLVWIGLWNLADDEGRLLDELGILAGDLWALSLSEAKLDKTLDELDSMGRIIRYEVAGQAFIQVTNWVEHQRINKPTLSALPPASLRDDSRRSPVALLVGREGKGRDKEGEVTSVTEPPLFCVSHPEGAKKGCGPCGDARRLHAKWLRDEKSKPVESTPTPRAEATCEHDRPLSVDCPICAEAVAS